MCLLCFGAAAAAGRATNGTSGPGPDGGNAPDRHGVAAGNRVGAMVDDVTIAALKNSVAHPQLRRLPAARSDDDCPAKRRVTYILKA